MTDQDQSHATASSPEAPAPTAPAATAATADFSNEGRSSGSFGTTRGSGLGRGKRATPPPAPTSSTQSPTGYTPSAIEMVNPQSEYRNPFAPEPAPAAPVAVAAPVQAPVPVQVQAAPAAIVEAPAPVTAPAPVVAQAPAPAAEPEADSTEASPADEDEIPGKAEIKILPSEEPVRQKSLWTHGDQTDRREERPSFRPDFRRDTAGTRDAANDKPAERTGGRDFNARRSGSDQRPAFEARPAPSQAASAPAPVAKKASGGFFGWLKGLFGGGKPAAAPAPSTGAREGESGEFRHEGRNRRRRRRGGQRHSGGEQNRNPGQGHGENRGDNRGEGRGENRGEGRGGDGRHGGGRRHRSRGGRSRHGGGDPRPEGHQGGGAI